MRGRQGRERLVAPPSRNLTGVDGAAGSASASGGGAKLCEPCGASPLLSLGEGFSRNRGGLFGDSLRRRVSLLRGLGRSGEASAAHVQNAERTERDQQHRPHHQIVVAAGLG